MAEYNPIENNHQQSESYLFNEIMERVKALESVVEA